MESTIYGLGLLCLTWLFVKGSEPLQFLKKLVNLHNDTPLRNVWMIVLRKLVNCSLCSGFWIGLIYYQNILSASLFAICAEVFDRLLKLIFKYI